MAGHNIVKLFEARKGNLNHRVSRDYVRNGIATIPCRISDYSDVISTYSVRGCESLNPDFADYLQETAEVIPSECPIVLNIIGDCLSQEEKKIIENTILDDFAYNLGMVEKEEKRHLRIFYLMFFGLIILAILLFWMHIHSEEPFELFFILFYFIGDTLCDYVFLTGHDLRRDRRLAGRLASIRVTFSESYEEPDYSKNDAERLYTEIEKDVAETIQEDE